MNTFLINLNGEFSVLGILHFVFVCLGALNIDCWGVVSDFASDGALDIEFTIGNVFPLKLWGTSSLVLNRIFTFFRKETFSFDFLP